ncbi:replication protein, partial [Gluconobacter oxydans]
MTDERELDDGLAAFDQLGREMAETNRLLRAVRSDQAARNQQEHDLSAEMRAALKQATGASQKALQAAQTEIRSSLLWTGLTAFLIVLVAFGGGYFFGQRAGWETGHADGYQKAR